MAKKQKGLIDRFFLVRLTRDEHKVETAIILIGVLLLILFANTAYLTYLSFTKQERSADAQKTVVATPTAIPSPTVAVPSIVQTTSAPVAAQTGPQVKEIFIPFGSGSTTATSWTDVPGLTAQIDFGKYTDIKEVHFEATIGIPTQNQSASVQLFNETDKHPVWYSPITLTDGQFVSSNPIVWDTGPKIYQVQMMTSLGFLANLYSARIHIILK